MSDPVLAEREGSTLVLRLNRPDRLNALSWDLDEALAGELARAAVDDAVRSVVLTGVGRAFSAGGDVKDQRTRQAWSAVERHTGYAPMLDWVQSIWDFPKPLIGAINGVAAGAGAGLALLCDVRYGAQEMRFGFPFPRVGLGPDWGVSYTLPRVIGAGHAARLMFTGGYVDAAEALALGLVERVLPADELLAATLELCAEIGERAPFAVRLAKEALRRSATMDLPSVLRTEMLAQQIAMVTDDHREGTAAFAEKRPARFTNR